MKLLYITALFSAIAFPLSAQKVYTLDQCIEEAVMNNAKMRTADNNVAASQEQKKQAFTNYFPSISANGNGFLSNKELFSMEVVPGMGMGMLKDGIAGGVTATMPVFAGGQIVNGNKLAEVGVEASKLQRNMTENEVRLSTEQYFWQIVMLKEKLVTIEAVESQLDAIHKDVEAAVRVGVANRNDLLQVQLRANETLSGRIQIENALSTMRSLLAQQIGHAGDSIDVAFALTDSLPSNPLDLHIDHSQALTSTNEYNLLQQNVNANRLQYRMAVGKNLPTVAIGGGYMYDNLMGSGRSYAIGFATVSIPLSGWWGGSHDMKNKKLQIKNAETQLTDQSELLVIRMNSLWNDLNNAYRQVEIAMQSIGQSAENLRLQTNYYRAGTCTMTDLLNAQTLYQQSRDQYTEKYTQYEIKRREYLQSTGR